MNLRVVFLINTAVLISVVLMAYFGMSDMFFNRMYNSDCMYLPSVYHELFIEHQGFKGFKLNGQPNFFPDMFIYFPLYFITGNIVWSGIIYSITQLILLLVLLFLISKEYITGFALKAFITLSTLFFAIMISSCLVIKNSDFVFHLLANGFHTSAFLMSLASLFFSIKIIKEKRTIWLMLLLSSVLIDVFNDRLYLFLFPLPFILTELIFLANSKKKSNVKIIAYLFIVSLIGYYIFYFFPAITSLEFIKQGFSFNIDNTISSFVVFVEMWKSVFLTININALFFTLGIISFFYSIYSLKNKPLKQLNLFSVLFFTTVLLAPILLGMFNNPTKLRYSIFVFYFMPIIGLLNLTYSINNKLILNRLITLSVICLILVIGLGTKNFRFDKMNFRATNFRPRTTNNLDTIHQHHPDLLNGVGDYWNAKQTTYFSKTGLKVYAVFYPDLRTNFYTGHKKWWYYGQSNQEPSIFNFIVINSLTDTSYYKSIIPGKLETITYNSTSIIKTQKFIYKPGCQEPTFIDK